MRLVMLWTAAPLLLCLSAGCGDPAVQAQVNQPGGSEASSGLAFHGQPWRDPNAIRSTAAPAGAHLTYFGGRVVSNMQVVQVLYGTGSYLSNVSATTSPSMATFYQGVLNSAYVDWLTEYNTNTQAGTRTNQVIGRGSFLRQVAITPSAANNGTTISDAQVQAELKAQIASGALPAPTVDALGNDNTYYAVFFPHGKTITQGGSNSCQAGGFCAYHGTATANSGAEFYYGVHPDMQAGSGCDTGCGSAATSFGNYTSVASHEMVETITDCEVGFATVAGPPLAWYDNTNGEIGDICNAQQGSVVGSDGVTYVVQTEFSNVANNCIVSRTVANDFSVSLSPTARTVAAGSSGTVTVSLGITSGSAQTVSLSASGLPAGVTAAFSPASVTGAGTSTLTLTAAAGAAVGTTSVTVSGTATSGTHTAVLSLTVTSTTANDFSLTATPASLSVAAGSSGTSTVATAVTTGVAQTVTLSASGVPAGVTASFSPASVSAGQSSTLTLATTAAAAAGTYTVTVTGTGSSATHTANVSLTITTTGGGGALTNGGFESGLTGWTTAGAASVATTGCHGGAGCLDLGLTTPTNGDSTAAQTFTAPAGATGLSLWYKETCPDTITYDWAIVTLKDNTAGTTATLVAKQCATNAWTQVSGAIVAGHSYTLTLLSHDDNYAADPTYTLYDDVTLTTSAPPPTGITNGGFESGLTGWTATGASETASTTGCHGGAGCAQLGATSPTNGDSTLAQTFTAGAGSTGVTFWYKMTCPDTITYDWATATLKDNTTGTTATLLAKVCTTNAWTQVSGTVVAGHSYTLSLTSHDDNYSADPSYTLYDDVALK